MIQSLFANAVLALAAGDHAALHPADVDLYIEAPDVQSLIQAYAQAPLVQMLNDPSVAKIGEVAGQMGFDIRAMLNDALPSADASHPNDPFWPWSATTRVSLSLSGLEGATRTGALAPDGVSGWIVVDFADAVAATRAFNATAALNGVTKVSVKDDETLDWNGKKIAPARFETSLGGARVQAWLAQSDERLLAGLGGAKPSDFVARLSKPETSFSAKAKTLAEDSKLSAQTGTILVRAWSDLERIQFPGDGVLDSALARDAIDKLLPAFLPFCGAKGRWRLSLAGTRFVSESVYERIGPAKELDLLYGVAPIDGSVARKVPKEAVGTWLAKIDPARFESELEHLLVRAPAAAASKDAASTAKLSDGLGDTVATYLLPFAGVQSLQKGLPRLVICVGHKDEAKLQAGLDAWIDRLRKLDPKLIVENKPYHKFPLYTFTSPALAGRDASGSADAAGEDGASVGLAAMRPTIAVLHDCVLITLERSVAQSEIRRVESKSTDVHAITAEGFIPRDAFEVSTMSWGGLIGKLYDLARGFAPMLAQGSDKSIDINALPTSAELFRFFEPSFSYSKRVEGGIYTRSESSFGPEIPLALAALTAVSIGSRSHDAKIARTAREHESEASTTPGSKPKDTKPITSEVDVARKSTLDSLRSVKTGLAVYRGQVGRYPDSLQELLKGTDSFPNGFLEGGVVPKDAWNHALVYAASDAGAKYALRSSGADGVDQNGASDDVNVP